MEVDIVVAAGKAYCLGPAGNCRRMAGVERTARGAEDPEKNGQVQDHHASPTLRLVPAGVGHVEHGVTDAVVRWSHAEKTCVIM